MNTLEKKMLEKLIDLKENHNVIGVKAEFEAEGTRMEEALRLKEIAAKARLDLSVKIGGCEALKDIYDAKVIGTEAILAPMIESPYAMKKFINAAKSTFSEDEREDTKFWINIETEIGYQNFDKMLQLPESEYLEGVVLGRYDLACSMGLTSEDVNCKKIFEIANDMAQKCFNSNKKFTIGGAISISSLSFLQKLPKGLLHKFETRKIIFDAQKVMSDFNAKDAISKALEFELMWLKNKRDFYKSILEEDSQRLVNLESRFLETAGKIGKIYV